MKKAPDFHLLDFMPYQLNQAAEASSLNFQKIYKKHYGVLRTEWRVMFHLGRYGEMTAKEICERAKTHKTKISRAVKALETKRYLTRSILPDDRRHEILALTRVGHKTYVDLSEIAQRYDRDLEGQFSVEERKVLRKCLRKLAKF